MYCSNDSKEIMISLIYTDEHSPGEWRVKGSLMNSPGFRKAYGCKQGDNMYKENMYDIW